MANNQLQIPITVNTNLFETGDKGKDDRLRLDQMSYYLSSIFWCLEHAAKSYDLLEGESGIKLFTFPEFRFHVQNLAEIGNALAERLTVYTLAIKNDEKSEVTND